MWRAAQKAPIWEFLGWLLLVWGLCEIAFFFLEPYSVAFAHNGALTAGYVAYAIIGIFISTPSPMIATYITLKRHKKINSIKDFCKLIFHTPSVAKTVLTAGAFCLAALCAAFIFGKPTGTAWYFFIASLPVMVIGGGVEEVGWRGFLQPALEKKFHFPIATIMVGIIRYVWHLPLWLQPTSNHYGDSLIGFAITILIWAFVGAAIYKSTKSVFACVMYHAFINAIGAIYDWNALFDSFPNTGGMYVYYSIILIAAIVIWVLADKNSKKISEL